MSNSPFRPRYFLPGLLSPTVPDPQIDPQQSPLAQPGNGPIAGFTNTFSLNLVNFDWITWHNYEWENWIVVDALLNAAIGFLNIKGFWKPNTDYLAGQSVFDPANVSRLYLCLAPHTSGTDFEAEKPLYWKQVDQAKPPVSSVFGRIGDVIAAAGDYAAFYADKAATAAHIARTDNPHGTSWATLLNKPATFPPAAHTHVEADITNLDKYTRAEVDTLIASCVRLAGSTMTGFLTLSASPTALMHAANKGYVDAGLNALDTELTNDIAAAIATRLPLTGGALSGFLTLHADPAANGHAANKGYVDAQVATRLTKAQADALYLSLAGGTLTGALTLPGAPTQPQHAATKAFVEQLIAGSGSATHVGDTPPTTPKQGQLWYRTAEPVGLFVWYVDADSSQWVQVSGGSGGSTGGGAPIGSVSYFASQNPPPGWLLCNGQAITAAYPELRAYLIAAGSPFGSSGADPRVPDLRGEFIRGHDQGRGVDAGRVFGSAQGDAIRNIVGALNTNHSLGLWASGGASGALSRDVPGSFLRSSIVGNAGGASFSDTFNFDASRVVPTASENRPRNIALLPCIKAFDTLTVAGSADFNIATDAQVRAGTSTDTLLTPANVRALSGAQTIVLNGQQFIDFTNMPQEATEIALIINGLNYPANAVVYLDLAGNADARCWSTRQLFAAAYAPPVGDDNNTRFVLDNATSIQGLTGLIMLARDSGGTPSWVVSGTLRRSSTSYLSYAGVINSMVAVLGRLRLNSTIAFTAGTATARWRI